ncbi:hypothetical protein FGK63_01745 [Ruegeria sediminis]|uniref:Phage tail assembly protein n=1 Tax=Ruegeria sediminis TaxID=2583820 RepID=A0ABY2X417_9RHOB|nr:hypothetical protein [Ruegeria sediminis]TMV09818.1 hypothetical protein FGK63_01745 [Ruegeria sediminis]
MLKITETPVFTHVVKIPVPADEGHRDEQIRATFLALPDDELAEFNLSTLSGQKDLLRKVTKGLRDIVGDDDVELPFTPELLEQLIGRSWARGAMINAYCFAIAAARRGN